MACRQPAVPLALAWRFGVAKGYDLAAKLRLGFRNRPLELADRRPPPKAGVAAPREPFSRIRPWDLLSRWGPYAAATTASGTAPLGNELGPGEFSTGHEPRSHRHQCS